MKSSVWKRLLSLAVAGVLLGSCGMNALGLAPEQTGGVLQRHVIEESYVNPLYAGIVEPEDLAEGSGAEKVRPSAETEVEYLTSTETAGAEIRAGMKARTESIEVHFQAPEYSRALIVEIADAALAHTGVPDEGDYLRWQYGGWKSSTSYYEQNGSCYMTITYTYTYYTTAEQEATVTQRVEEVLAELNVSSAADYEKISEVYRYICAHTTYDHEHLEDEDYTLKYTAYAALIDGQSVCQGYALLLYRMLLELGVDCRFISGKGNGGAHGWNIVALDGLYYNADATWDAGESEYRYFLKCEESFTDHVRDESYTTDEFNAAYPMAPEDYDPSALEQGTCGDGLTWTLDRQGLLTVSGSGAMADGAGESIFPDPAAIRSVVIEENVGSIGAYAFAGCVNLQRVTLSSTVAGIGEMAFSGCTSLTKIALPASVTEIGAGAWSGCVSLTTIWAEEDNPSYASVEGVLYSADRKELVAYPGGKTGEYAIPEGTQSIGNRAFFSGAAPAELTVPASVTEIGDYALADLGSSLSSVRFAAGAPSFGTGVFDGTTTTILYPASDESWDSAREQLQQESGELTWSGYRTQLETPVIISVYSKVQDTAKVSWNPVEGADGYLLYRATSPDAENWDLIKTVTGDFLTSHTYSDGSVWYTNVNLTVGTTYYYKVAAFAGQEDGTTLCSECSDVGYMPAAVVFGNVYSNSTSRSRLLWNEVGGSTGYQIWRSDDGGETWKIVKTVGDKGNTLTDNQGATTAYSNTGLEAGKTYIYRMRAFCIPTDGTKVYGAYSDDFAVAVLPEAPELTVTQVKSDRVSLSWDQVSGAAGYQIWRAEGDSQSYVLVKSITNGDTTSYINRDLHSGSTYSYRVRAYAEASGRKSFSAYSGVQKVQTP